MALDELLHAIRAEAEEEVAARRRAARDEAAALLAAAEIEAAAEEARIGAEALADAEAEAERRLAAARLEAARRVRAAREDGYLALRERLAAELAGVRSTPGYPALLAASIDEALAVLGEATRLRVDPRDEAAAAAHVARLGRAIAVEPTVTTWGGAEAADEHGRGIANTLEARLEAAEPQLRMLCAVALRRAA